MCTVCTDVRRQRRQRNTLHRLRNQVFVRNLTTYPYVMRSIEVNCLMDKWFEEGNAYYCMLARMSSFVAIVVIVADADTVAATSTATVVNWLLFWWLWLSVRMYSYIYIISSHDRAPNAEHWTQYRTQLSYRHALQQSSIQHSTSIVYK